MQGRAGHRSPGCSVVTLVFICITICNLVTRKGWASFLGIVTNIHLLLGIYVQICMYVYIHMCFYVLNIDVCIYLRMYVCK